MSIDTSSSHPSPAIPAAVRDRLADSLARDAAGRERQLAELPPPDGDLVAAAHRESVLRILSEIRGAQERLASDDFGRCERCRAAIPLERLELRPWTTLCVGCARMERS